MKNLKILTGAVSGTPQCLPNNAIYSGNTKIAQVFGRTVEEANANTILFSKAPELLEELKHVVRALKTVSSFGATTSIIENAEKLIKDANYYELR